MDKVLSIALRKCQHFDKKTWCGPLTPTEFLRLIKETKVKAKDWEFNYAVDCKKKGINNSTWRYFEANEKFLELKRGYVD